MIAGQFLPLLLKLTRLKSELRINAGKREFEDDSRNQSGPGQGCKSVDQLMNIRCLFGDLVMTP